MNTRNILKTLMLISVILCLILSASCAKTPSDSEQGQTTAGKTDPASDSTSETTSSDTAADPKPEDDGIIKKIQVVSDDVGIYSTVITLGKNAADKGVIEMIYTGAKGTPQEDSVVNTFRIEYSKDENGKYDISTFFYGEVYQNQRGKEEVKVVNTFDASLRAGDITVFYTPDGGEKQEIYKADAEQFMQ
ncbi:MAG: hypothetical protein KBT31_05650 [Firmicutes bacterium]|nr:hypothetical protein [Candidatus Colimorpha enterica]